MTMATAIEENALLKLYLYFALESTVGNKMTIGTFTYDS